MSDRVGNPEDRFSHNKAQIMRALSRENLSLGFPTRSNTNPAVQPQKMGRGLKFQIQGVEKMSYMYVVKTKFYINVKLGLISDTYCILIFAIPYCYLSKSWYLS